MILTITGAAALATVLAFLLLVPFLPRFVTWAALADARRLVADLRLGASGTQEDLFTFRLSDPPPWTAKWDKCAAQLSERYRRLFQGGYLDREYLIAQFPADRFTQEALPPLLVLQVYLKVNGAELEDDEAVAAEAVRWARSLLRSARAKETLVHYLSRDWEPVPGRGESGGIVKMLLYYCITIRDVDDYGWGRDVDAGHERIAASIVSGLRAEDWEGAFAALRHQNDAVRAGSLLLLCHHPNREMFREGAREALNDPAELVRIAAAGTLAYHGDGDGQDGLIAGLRYPSWEVRWWCGKSLCYLGTEEAERAIASRKGVEPPGFFKDEIEDMLHSFERTRRSPGRGPP